MNIKRFKWPVILLFLIVFLSCGRKAKIGIILSTNTSLGYEENLAVRFYRDTRQNKVQSGVEYIIKNTELSKDAIRNAYMELEKEGVAAIAGGAISFEGLVLAEESMRSGIPTFGISPSSHYLSKKKDSFYRILLDTNHQGRYCAEYVNSLNLRKAAVFTDFKNRSYSEAVAKSFSENFNGKTLMISYKPDPGMWNSYFRFKPDLTIMIMPAKSMIDVIKKAGMRIPSMKFMASSWGYEQLAERYLSPEIEGVMSFTIHGFKSEKYSDLVKSFEETRKINTHFGTLYTFSVLDILNRAISEGGSSRKKINEYLGKPAYHEFAYGELFMDSYGDSFPEYMYIKEIKNEKIVLKKKIKIKEFPER